MTYLALIETFSRVSNVGNMEKAQLFRMGALQLALASIFFPFSHMGSGYVVPNITLLWDGTDSVCSACVHCSVVTLADASCSVPV